MARLLADITPLRRSPEFRRLWWGLGLASIGTQLTATAVGLEVYDITRSTLSVGIIGAVGLVPTVVFGLYGGALADAHDRRLVALVASVVMWVATLGLVAQAVFDLRRVWVLYLLVAIQAGASSVNGPARSAIIPRLVSLDQLPAANALNMVTMTLSSLAGPMVGATLVALIGYPRTYLVDAVAFTFALYAILRLPPIRPVAAEEVAPVVVRPWVRAAWASARTHTAAVVDGFRFLAGRRNLLMTFLSDMSAMIFAFPRATFPAAAAVILGGGTSVAGALASALAVGSLFATVLSGPLMRLRHQGRAVSVSVGAWGFFVACAGGAYLLGGRTSPSHVLWPALIAAMVAFALAGAADAVSAVFRGTILLAATPDALRGRLQGVFTVVVAGGPRLGDVFVGATSSAVGEGWALVIGGAICLIAIAALSRWHRGFLAYDSHHPVA
ncbi:MAG: MFS transporter [Actinomycetia bacterium]|nr:MFS transporter [Actinomycetes bacterium]